MSGEPQATYGTRLITRQDRAYAVKRELIDTTSPLHITEGMRRHLRRVSRPVRLIDRSGFWLAIRGRHIAYWTPWTFQPLSVREGLDPSARRGWWGALRIERHEPT